MTKDIEHSFSQDKMHILMPNTQQMMRDKLVDSLKEFHQWSDLIRSGEAEVTSMSIKRKPKPWIGLTAEEVADLWLDILVDTPASGVHEDGLQPWRFARAIEAKLKEKNNVVC